jgi:hypothetical protein
MGIYMSKSVQITGYEADKAIMVLFEQYLPKVFGYIQYWVQNAPVAENLTLSSLKQFLSGCQSYVLDTQSLSKKVFSAARGNVHDYLKKNQSISAQPILSVHEMEIIAFKFGARLGNREIASILGLSQPIVATQLCQCLIKLTGDRQ